MPHRSHSTSEIHVHPNCSHAEIVMSTGHVAVIDAADVSLVERYIWLRLRSRQSLTDYAVTSIDGKPVYLHRLLMGARKGQVVDHVNRDGLDCRRNNLRFCNTSRNQANRISRRGSSQYKGVFAARGKWCATIGHGPGSNLGYFLDEADAARAYDAAARARWGAFARVNFPLLGEQWCPPTRPTKSIDLTEQAAAARAYAKKRMRRYRSRPDVRERIHAWNNRPDVKARNKATRQRNAKARREASMTTPVGVAA